MSSPPPPPNEPPRGTFAILAALARIGGFQPWVFPAVLAFALGVPLLFAGIGAWLIHDAADFARDAEQVEAQVLRMEREPGEDGIVYLRPVLGFERPEGSPQERPMHEAATSWRFGTGDTITVLVNDGRPDAVRLPGWWNLYGLRGVFMGLGIVGVVAVLMSLRLLKRIPWLDQLNRLPPGRHPATDVVRRRKD